MFVAASPAHTERYILTIQSKKTSLHSLTEKQTNRLAVNFYSNDDVTILAYTVMSKSEKAIQIRVTEILVIKRSEFLDFKIKLFKYM